MTNEKRGKESLTDKGCFFFFFIDSIARRGRTTPSSRWLPWSGDFQESTQTKPQPGISQAELPAQSNLLFLARWQHRSLLHHFCHFPHFAGGSSGDIWGSAAAASRMRGAPCVENIRPLVRGDHLAKSPSSVRMHAHASTERRGARVPLFFQGIDTKGGRETSGGRGEIACQTLPRVIFAPPEQNL